VTPERAYSVRGGSSDCDEYSVNMARWRQECVVSFIEADIPLPAKAETVQGEVVG